MSAIIKRELNSYFGSAIGYIVLAVFYFFSGVFFNFYCLYQNSSALGPVFSNMLMIILFLMPLVTMKSFAEEKRQKTDQALLTAPISLFEMVMGKFFGAFILYVICNAIFIIYALIIAIFATPDWAVILCTLIGMLLMGAALLSIYLFISAMTESQVIAAVLSIGAGLLIYLLDSLSSLANVEFVTTIINAISFNRNLSNFTYGILSLHNVVYFLGVTAIFLFLTVRVFERRRWS